MDGDETENGPLDEPANRRFLAQLTRPLPFCYYALVATTRPVFPLPGVTAVCSNSLLEVSQRNGEVYTNFEKLTIFFIRV